MNRSIGWVCSGWIAALAGCHGKETDEVLAGLRAENAQLRAEVALVRAENVVQSEALDPQWPSTVSLKRAGGSGGRTLYRRACPEGQALKGFDAKVGTVIDALVPVCAPVVQVAGTKGTRTLERELAAIGGRGGRPAETACPGQTLMIGVRGKSADVLDSLEPVCEDGKHGTRLGGEGGREYERMCPVGWLAVGVTGRQGDYVESLSLMCADPRPLRGEKKSLIPPERLQEPDDPDAPDAPDAPETP